MRTFDATDIFDYQNACAVSRDWSMYLQAKRYGINSVTNPPVWLRRMVRREEGVPAMLMTRIKETLTDKQMLVMSVLTQMNMNPVEAANFFGVAKSGVCALIQRAETNLAKAMGIDRTDVKKLMKSLSAKDWGKVGLEIAKE